MPELADITAYVEALEHRILRRVVERVRVLSPFVLRTAREVLAQWSALLRTQAGDAFPENVTAFRPEMGVHGKCGQPCPVCGTRVARIVCAENETNYCPRCQTGGQILADRALSRLSKKSWPRFVDERQ